MSNKEKPENTLVPAKPQYPQLYDTSGLGALPIIAGAVLVPIGIPAAMAIGGIAGAVSGLFSGGVMAGIGAGLLIGGGAAVAGIATLAAVTIGFGRHKEKQNHKKRAAYKQQMQAYKTHLQNVREKGYPGPVQIHERIFTQKDRRLEFAVKKASQSFNKTSKAGRLQKEPGSFAAPFPKR